VRLLGRLFSIEELNYVIQPKLKDKIGLGNTFVELVDSDIFLCGLIPEGNLVSLRKSFLLIYWY
jgi:hypothetical protein